jgi:hypothetical protein
MQTSDGKMRMTDVADNVTIVQADSIYYFTSAFEPFKLGWHK